ncbi:MAG: DUF4838 domain-containing protein, partial [Candidatus Binataceae bacterium]
GEWLDTVEPFATTPAFARRALVSDIMTWHYDVPDNLRLHLEHDRVFIDWMAARGLNAFSYIRHAQDTRLKIDELVPLYRQRGIASEYGGHVLQLLLPRERFKANPEYFPLGADGIRMPRGNLCVSNRDALEAVKAGALRYVRENPEGESLHIWGADVWEGAWCRCAQCADLAIAPAYVPQLQYMAVVNAIAEALANETGGGPPVAYLAYHDTLEPVAALRPLPNVWFEWAPRERCYSHAIDDPACETNPRYFESLKRYIELFQGRGHVFEYYADAILFGGLGFATPGIIARDLRAYRALGLGSISCLTFGAWSALAYPVNLEAFARGTRSPDFEPESVLADTAAELHPACAAEVATAYHAIERASALILAGGGDVMRPRPDPRAAAARRAELAWALDAIAEGIAAADHLAESARDRLGAAERAVWQYGREVVSGISDYLAAAQAGGKDGLAQGDAAIKKIGEALQCVRAIDPSIKGTWGANDLERLSGIWLQAMRRRLENA